MAFAPHKTYKDIGDGSIIGYFKENDFGAEFEYSVNNTGQFPEYSHLVWVGGAGIYSNQYRFANVLKTVARIATDENDDGSFVVEKWQIKNHRVY